MSAAKAGRKAERRPRDKAETRQRIIKAAFDTMRAEGFAGTSARAIAATGGFDQALVFYYFGSVNDLLLAALADSSVEQLRQYEETLAEVDSLPALFTAVAARFADDMASGHVKVLAEMIGASAGDPRLSEAVGSMVDPWLVLTERTMERLLGDSGLGALVPADQIAFVVVALFLGMDLLVNLTGDESRVPALFESGQRVAALFGGLTGAASTEGDR